MKIEMQFEEMGSGSKVLGYVKIDNRLVPLQGKTVGRWESADDFLLDMKKVLNSLAPVWAGGNRG